MNVLRRLALIAVASTSFVAPASAEGSLGLDEVLTAVAKAPKLVAEIQVELDKNSLKAPDITCIAARHGNQWKYLGGGRAAPYECEIGRRSITIEADRVYFDPKGKSLGDLDKADPKRAKTFHEDNFRWTGPQHDETKPEERNAMSKNMNGPLRIGIGGPVGSGKTALMDLLCKSMRERYDIAAITNDIYTKWDAEFLVRSGSLTPDRIAGVETGGCPHTAIREDASMNLAAVADMRAKFPNLDLVLIESGGDNLAATFSPELADLTIYVIDVAAGDKIPSKGGPGITRSDLLVINKIDLAPHVGASLEKMDIDAKRMRGERPFVMTNLKKSEGLDRIIGFIETKGGLRPAAKAKAS